MEEKEEILGQIGDITRNPFGNDQGDANYSMQRRILEEKEYQIMPKLSYKINKEEIEQSFYGKTTTTYYQTLFVNGHWLGYYGRGVNLNCKLMESMLVALYYATNKAKRYPKNSKSNIFWQEKVNSLEKLLQNGFNDKDITNIVDEKIINGYFEKEIARKEKLAKIEEKKIAKYDEQKRKYEARQEKISAKIKMKKDKKIKRVLAKLDNLMFNGNIKRKKTKKSKIKDNEMQ